MPEITIQPPLGGVSKRAPFQSQPPFTAYTSTNFWGQDVATGRAVLATRPALSSVQSPGTPCNLLGRVNGVHVSLPQQSMVAAVSSDLFYWNGSGWLFAGGDAASAVDTGRAVYSAPFLQQSFIMVEDQKPIVFDYPTGQADYLTEIAGICPDDCRVAQTWQGALWVAGQETAPLVLYCSRTGNAFDWDFAADIEDTGGAFFMGGEDAGLLNGPITALVNHTTDTMIVSTVEGLYALRGHPRRGGVVEQLSGVAYILGQGAWTKGPDDVLYFLTQLGMMRMDPTPNAIPTPISRDKIPDELIGLTYSIADPTISMAYCSRFNMIYLTDRTGSGQAWAYDVGTGAFWEMTLTSYPYCLMEFPPFISSTASGVLFTRSS